MQNPQNQKLDNLTGIERIKALEDWTIAILNLDGWQLESSNDFDHYDAIGLTPKGHKCIIEMKFRNDYYEDKLLEKYKYDALMEYKDYIKIYFVADKKGNYMYWLDNLIMPEVKFLKMGKTTLWDSDKITKAVYLLSETKATIINRNEI